MFVSQFESDLSDSEEKPVEKVVGGPTAARGPWNWSYKTCTGACGRNMDRGGGGK